MTTNLDSFTDVLGDVDVIDDSQPLSLSPEENNGGFTKETAQNPRDRAITTTETARFPRLAEFGYNAPIVRHERPKKHTGQHGDFRSVEEIDPKYRGVFSYPYFNLVQSSVIDDALYSDKSMVVCAPTGSGKTVVFEMAIVQLLMALDDSHYVDDFKIIYMAPVKALCTERLTEWYSKFTNLGILCIEVTGDTDVDFSQLNPYRIIITTPEKWDMLTRRWRDHKSLVSTIKLFLIDEVHILNDASRGPVLEAVVSRMKTIESSFQSAHRIELLQKQYQESSSSASQATTSLIMPGIRFVAVSATVANPQDVAAWLGTMEKPAVYYKFGDECRPVKLQRVVEGYPCGEGCSIFKFDIILNYKLWPIINKHHNGKPTLIFCNTRKSVALTAETLSKEVTVTFSPEQRAKLTALANTIKNKKLQTLVLNGVGCHHAGLLYEERLNIEQAFRNRDLPILITTTTLAMGVNLPAHLVIIKNTQQYVNGQYQEYSISTVLQMVGRAGRPQFDTEATAVIMTRMQDKPRYQALVGGDEPLQSYLHKRLAENLNSEAALGTVNDVAQCVQWLRSTFLCVRAAKDPKRYLGLTQASAPAHIITKKLEELCVKAMNSLASSGLISMDEASCIESTEAGRLMSVYYLDLETMKHIMKINGTETLDKLLWLICESHELADMYLRVDERRTLNLLNRNNAAATIRYTMKGKISSRQMKLYCIIQAVLGCLPIPDPSLNQEAMKIMRIADRVCKCLVAYVTRAEILQNHPQYFSAVLNSIVLTKCIAAHLWDNSPYVSKQLKGIGPTFSTLLASAGKTNFVLLEESHPRDLERIMNKGPPAGNVIRKQVGLLPRYQLSATSLDENTVAIQLVLLNQAHLSENMDNLTAGDNHKSYIVVGDSENHLLLLTTFKDKDLISVYDGTIKYEIKRIHNFEHKIIVHCVSSNFVGIDAQCDYTFKDVAPLYSRGEASSSYSIQQQTPKKTNKTQTNITDTYKQRKRKNVDTDISKSKEKIKRESNLVEKFKNLKQQFGAASKNIKDNLNKTSEMTSHLIHDNFNSNTENTENLRGDASINASVLIHNGNTAAAAPVKPVYEPFPGSLQDNNNFNAFGSSFNQNTAVRKPIRPVHEATFINASEYKHEMDKNTVPYRTNITKPLTNLQTNQNNTEVIPRMNEYFSDDVDYPYMVPDCPDMVPYYTDMVQEDNDGGNFIVDDHVEDILSEIENEISKSRSDSRKINIISDISLHKENLHYIANSAKSDFAIPKETAADYYNRQLKRPKNLGKVNLKSKLFTKQESYNPVENRRKKPTNTKSNYSFIDTIEKKFNDESDDIETVTESKSGFSDAIKQEIEKFLSNAKTCTNSTDSKIQKLFVDDKNSNKYPANIIQNEKFIDISELPEIATTKRENINDMKAYSKTTEENEIELLETEKNSHLREIDLTELPDVCVDSERKINQPTKDKNGVNDESNYNIDIGEQTRYCKRKINAKSIKDTCEWLQKDIEKPNILAHGEEWTYPQYNSKLNTINDVTDDIEMVEHTRYPNCKPKIDFAENIHKLDYHMKEITNSHEECYQKLPVMETGPQYTAKQNINNNKTKHEKIDKGQGIDIQNVITKFGKSRDQIYQRTESEIGNHNTYSTLNQNIHQEKPEFEVKSVIAIYDQMRKSRSETSNNMDSERRFTRSTNEVDIQLFDLNTLRKPILQTETYYNKPEESDKAIYMSKSVDLKHRTFINTNNITAKDDNYDKNSNNTIIVVRNDLKDKLSRDEHTTQNRESKSTLIALPFSDTHNYYINKTTEEQDTSTTIIPLPYPHFNTNKDHDSNIDGKNNKLAMKANNSIAIPNYSYDDAQNNAEEKLSGVGDEHLTLSCYPDIQLNLNNVDQRDRTENNRTQDLSIDAYKAYLNSLSTHTINGNHGSKKNNKDQYVNKYSFTGTKIDVSTKNTREHQVQIIKRLKIDLDVTEIVSKTNTKVHNNEKRQQESRAWYSDSVTRTKPASQDNARLLNYFTNNTSPTLPEIHKVGEIEDDNNIVVTKNKHKIRYPEHETSYKNAISHTTKQSSSEMTANYNYKVDESKSIKYVPGLRSKRPLPMLKGYTTIDNIVQDGTAVHYETPNNNEQGQKGATELMTLDCPNDHKINKINNIEQNNSDRKEASNYMRTNNNLQTKIDKKAISTNTKMINYEQMELKKHEIEKCKKPESGKENKKVKSILEKYGTKLRKTTIDLNTSKNIKHAPFFKQPDKPKRPFKIREIHTAEVDLPKTIEVEVARSQRPTDDEVLTRVKGIQYSNASYENTGNNFEHEKSTKRHEPNYTSYNNTQNDFDNDKTHKKRDNIRVTFYRAMSFEDDKLVRTDLATQSNTYGLDNSNNNLSIMPIIDDIPELYLPSTQFKEMSADYNNYDLDLDKAMFNPKAVLERLNQETIESEALLQCFTEDTNVDTNIIPPPMEYCENNIYNNSVYSPTIIDDQDSGLVYTYDENDFEELDQSKYEESYAESDHNLTENAAEHQEKSIFDDERNILTPSNEIETWTFSPKHESECNKMYTPQKSCTVMRRNPGGSCVMRNDSGGMRQNDLGGMMRNNSGSGMMRNSPGVSMMRNNPGDVMRSNLGGGMMRNNPGGGMMRNNPGVIMRNDPGDGMMRNRLGDGMMQNNAGVCMMRNSPGDGMMRNDPDDDVKQIRPTPAAIRAKLGQFRVPYKNKLRM